MKKKIRIINYQKLYSENCIILMHKLSFSNWAIDTHAKVSKRISKMWEGEKDVWFIAEGVKRTNGLTQMH